MHFKTQEKLLKLIKNKLKPNGKIIIFEYTFSNLQRPTLRNYVTQNFLKLNLTQKLMYLRIMDWLANVAVLKRKIPMPYSFRTYEEWKELFINLDYKIAKSKFIGFPKEFFHQGPYCLFVLK
jgi:hypothetical protein